MNSDKVPRGRHGRQGASESTQRTRASRPSHAEMQKYGRGNTRYSASKASGGMALWKKVLLGVVAAVVLLGGAAAAYASWYMHRIDEALLDDSIDMDAVAAVTDSVNLDEPFYMLIMGSDSRDDAGVKESGSAQGSGERSDVIILARIDASQRQVTLVSVPRDTPYTLEDGKTVKINETYNIGGAAETIKAVETVSGVDISHFAELRFSDLENMVDALGGVTVNVDTPLSYKDALTGEVVRIEAGEQTLTGQQAQIFVRARHEYDTDQDVHRQNNVRQLATAMMKAVLDKPVTQIPDTVLELAQYIHTDLKSTDIIHLASSFSGGELTLYSCTGPNLGDFQEQFDGMWLCYPNPDGWAALMAAVDAGEDPSGIDVNSMAQKPESSEESQTEGTEEPAIDEEGSYLPTETQDEEGGYIEEYGTYYYDEPDYTYSYDNSYDAATTDTGGGGAAAVDAGGDAGTAETTADPVVETPVDAGESGGTDAAPVDAGGGEAAAPVTSEESTSE